MEFIKRTCKKTRQQLLNKILEEETEKLRKKCFPYKKKKLLRDEVIIRESNFENDTQAGQYNYTDKKHIILVDKLTLYSVHKMPASWIRKDYYKKVKNIVKHELIHALVEQEFEHICKNIIGKNRDASPVFLTVLNWCQGVSHHKCFEKFEHTDNYIESNCCINTYEDLFYYIIEMLYNYNKSIKNLEYISNEKDYLEQKGKIGLNIISNKFEFANRECGFTKSVEVKRINMFKENNKFRKKHTNILRTWEIGCNILPEQIAELYNKKESCDASNYNYAKSIAEFENGELKTLKVLKEKKNFGDNL